MKKEPQTKMITATQIQGIEATEILKRFAELGNKLDVLNSKIEKPKADELMTRNEVRDYLKVSLVTLNVWNKNGILVNHKIGNKVRYYKQDVLNATGQKNQHHKSK